MDAKCAANYAGNHGPRPRAHVLVGDQGNVAHLRRWAKKSGGNFDVIIDDGGHRNSLIYTSFTELWPHLKNGGVFAVPRHVRHLASSSWSFPRYFLEDLSMGRVKAFDDTNDTAARLPSDTKSSLAPVFLSRTRARRPRS